MATVWLLPRWWHEK